MVLCHGGPGLWDYLGPVASMIEDLCTVHRYDQRGGGRSPRGGVYTVDAFINDLEAIRQSFGYERVIVGGHSWGASLALFYGLRFPERVSALVYLNGTGLGRSWKPSYDARVERLSAADRARFAELHSRQELTAEEEWEETVLHTLCDLGARARRVEVAQQIVDRRFRVSLDVNATLNDEVKTFREENLVRRCQRLNVPVLVVAGEEDPRPPAAVEALVSALPQAELSVLSGVGHLPWLEDPETLRAVLRGFLTTVVAG
jgi:proline iminopeptidase